MSATARNVKIVLFGVLPAIAAGWMAQRYLALREAFSQAQQAYEAAQCEVAIAHYQTVRDRGLPVDFHDWQLEAEVKQVECQDFQALSLGNSGVETATLLAYNDFLNRYPDTALAAPLHQQNEALWQQAGVANLAKPDVCDRAEELQQNQLIAQNDTNLPLFYLACGQSYANAEQHPQAIAIYQRFLDNYSQHEKVEEVKAAWAKSMVLEAKDTGAGTIERPGLSGYTNDGTTVVEIRNDSPEKMRLVFSGPQPRYEEIEPCSDCETFFGQGPQGCPSKGPVGRYVLKPGQYDVVVKSISAQSVRPFTGTWQLDRNAIYNSCFFIVQQGPGM
jgi:tetratricopeptide (TPR) repeat protein